MREMSIEMATLLKSGKQIGNDRPTATVEIVGGEYTGGELEQFTHVYTGAGGLSYNFSNNTIIVTDVTADRVYVYDFETKTLIDDWPIVLGGNGCDVDGNDPNILWVSKGPRDGLDRYDMTTKERVTASYASATITGNGVAAPPGDYIWVGQDSGTYRLAKVHKTIDTDITFYDIPFRPSGVAWDGDLVWVSGYSTMIIGVDPATGGIADFFYGPQDNMPALTYDGQYLWTVLDEGSNNDTVLKFVIGEKNQIDRPTTIAIKRSKGMAGSLDLEFDNKNGVLSPDGLINPQLLWPNNEVVVKQGYGLELLKTFTGLIDSISMRRDSNGVASITISARDKLKVALDHLIRNQDFLYTLTYSNMLVEDIWKNLVGLAGLTYNIVEATGLTISEKTFSWETYADAFSWLDEIAGFETYCDEEGKLNFIWDGRPSVVTTAYQFVEGVDITRVGYEINDQDLFYTVAVYGKSPEVLDVDGNVVTESSVIYFAVQLPQATYWNVPNGKVLRIDAPDADTVAKCEIIADKAIYLMQTRARQVTFSTIGIPHLQRGDFIQVTESSSTISEIYRITDITTQQGPDGYGMTLTCYYHAAPEVV